MALKPGTRLGPYAIADPLGAGGMGEVYRATDTRLDRTVAIKILPESLAADAERIARFEREAKTLAALNHPNIAAIHGFEENQGIKALVMEFVDGPTLADRIAEGPIPIDDALPLATQIADALEAAHEQGIIHRDLKPANIKLRPDGVVKVLDFGLAKAMEPPGVMSPSVSQSPTITTPAMTQAGMILGTAAYMSPEQARGKPVDKRADIWAFGCVFYEMLSGERAFAGEGVSDVLASVLAREPDWTRLPAGTPARLLDLLRRLLAKDARDRLRDIGDARQEIGAARLDALPGSTPNVQAYRPSGPRTSTLVALGLSLAATVALAVPAVRHMREQAPTPREFRFDVESNEPVNLNQDRFALSPDGRSLVYFRSAGRVYLRRLDDLAPRELPGVVGARFAWSPDSRSVAFSTSEDRTVSRVSLDGAAPNIVASLSSPARGLAWGADGVILVATDEEVLRVPAEGGPPTVVVGSVAGVTYAHPTFLPDGTHFTYRQISRGANGGATAMLSSLDGGVPRRLFPAETKVEYVDPGLLLAGDGARVHAYPFDLERLEIVGERLLAFEGTTWFSVSRTGDVAYRTPIRQGSHLNWVDRTGGILGAVGEELGGGEVELSPDNRFAAIVVAPPGDIWLTDTTRGVASRFTSAPVLENWSTWSPDGKQLMFATGPNITVSDTAGAATPATVLEDSYSKMPSDWSPDGRYVLYFIRGRSETRGDIWLMPFDKSRAPEPFIATAAEESHAQFSPDGKWVSYDSDESGRVEVYVRPFPGTGARVRVSTEGGVAARWNPRGGELFFISPDGNLMSAGVRSANNGALLEVDRPKRLFPLRTWTGGSVSSARKIDYDVASDGNRFLVLQRSSDNAGWPIHVVANWQPRQSEPSR